MSPLSAAALSASSKSFENRKVQCLAKRDKSSAGRIDARCESLCDLVNAKFPFYYTTSSCSGRSYLYRGFGAKAGEALHSFVRYRVSHDRIDFPSEYFDLSTVPAAGHNGSGVDYYHPVDPTTSSVNAHAPTNDDGCGIVGAALVAANDDTEQEADASEVGTREMGGQEVEEPETRRPFQPLWLRYEPFILHVACRSLSAAWHLMRVARPSFKNVGLTAWNSHPENGGNATSSNNRSSQNGRYVVAIWGDEGLDMPLESPDGRVDLTQVLGHEYLASLVNDRHERNWGKMERFEQGLRELSVHEATVGDVSPEDDAESDIPSQTVGATAAPRSFDVIGDVAVLNTVTTTDPAELAEAGAAILRKNRALRVAVLRNSSLIGAERAPGDRGLTLLAGARRDPLITTHCEHGVKCVVDLHHSFFSPRMAGERLRLSQQVTDGEHVLVLFCGVGMDAMQVASRTLADSVTAVELNPVAVNCARRGRDLLRRNRAVLCPGAADRLKIVEGDVLEVLPTLQRDFYHRVVCPRPKEGAMDGDLGDGSGGESFLTEILPVMKQDGGVCHWYDFCSEPEYPGCERSRATLNRACKRHGVLLEILRIVRVGSVAMRQFRVCIDFCIQRNHIQA